MEQGGVTRFPGAWGRIPNFKGAEAAAERLRGRDAGRRARVIKCTPDSPQPPVRRAALRDGKTVYMAVPRLREERCFIQLDPAALGGRATAAASIKGASERGRPVLPEELPEIDLIVCGSVAVARDGSRLGKGGG